jgi:hypothetical protein
MYQTASRIKCFERKAREKYDNAHRRLQLEKQPRWFHQFLEENITPPLLQIGFERELIQALFQIAYPAWRQLGIVMTKCAWINPRLTSDLDRIRRETIQIAEEKRLSRAALAAMSADEVYHHVQESMAPRNLRSLVDRIGLSWIVLPRAYSLLQKDEVCCFMTYLNYLKKEYNPDFKKLLARIVIEFAANFSLKYASCEQPDQAVTETVFYGYAAMFWKNLSAPPRGCGDPDIHHGFLAWAKAFQKRTSFQDNGMLETAETFAAAGNKTDQKLRLTNS